MGIPSSPSRVPTGGFHHSYFVRMFNLAYINISLLARSKSVTTKKCEIKYEKNTDICRVSTATDPAKRGLKRTRIELTMLNFRLGGKASIASSPRGLMGLIAPSLLGTRGTQQCSPGVAPHSPRVWGLYRYVRA